LERVEQLELLALKQVKVTIPYLAPLHQQAVGWVVETTVLGMQVRLVVLVVVVLMLLPELEAELQTKVELVELVYLSEIHKF
jgi:hypothetical protein